MTRIWNLEQKTHSPPSHHFQLHSIVYIEKTRRRKPPSIMISVFSLCKLIPKKKKNPQTVKCSFSAPNHSLNNCSHEYLFIPSFINFVMSPYQMPEPLGTQQKTKIAKVLLSWHSAYTQVWKTDNTQINKQSTSCCDRCLKKINQCS